jgi:hypothetical protein
MKSIIYYSFVLLLIHCSSVADQPSGSYASSWTNEFSTVNDTLQIAPADRTGSFRVHRRMSIVYVHRDERLPQYKQESWMASYDGDRKSLVVRENGKEIFLGPQSVHLGTAEYKKIDDENSVDDRVVGY